MADSKLQSIMERISVEIQDEISPSGKLSFLNTEQEPVVITNERPSSSKFKNYRRYQIAIYPAGVSPFLEEQRIGNNVSRSFSIGLSLYRKAQKRRKLLIFSDSNDSDSGVGLLEFSNTIMDMLRFTTLNGTVNRRSRGLISPPAIVSTDEPGVEVADVEFFCEVLSSNSVVL